MTRTLAFLSLVLFFPAACGDDRLLVGQEADGGTADVQGGGGTGGQQPGTGGVPGSGGFTATGGSSTAPFAGLLASCGNGRLDPGEACDDANLQGADGCTRLCQIESRWICPVPGAPCTVRFVCGDGLVTGLESCDDGNTVGGDGCAADCVALEAGWTCTAGSACVPVCGDGLRAGSEACDDGNAQSGDGCSRACTLEPGPICGPAGCNVAICGDGIVSAGEACDFGEGNGDGIYGGCTKQCQPGPYCGDGAVQGAEECDLGTANGQRLEIDGCTVACRLYHYCGDGVVDAEVGEECDFGALNGQSRVPCAVDCAITPV